MNEFWEEVKNFLSTYGVRILFAFAILFIGLFLIKIISRVGKNTLRKSPLERTTSSFVIAILTFAMYLILAYCFATTLVPDVSAGLVAALGAGAVAIGLALKDSLGNFASGVIIIITKPFREGDYVSIGGTEGTVKAIGILATTLHTPDNKKITISNTVVFNSVVINYSARPTRRIDLDISVSYDSDIELVKKTLIDIAKDHPLVQDDPEPLCRLHNMGEYSLVFRYRVWVKNSDYWDVYWDLNEKIISKFRELGINIPFKTITLTTPINGTNEPNKEATND